MTPYIVQLRQALAEKPMSSIEAAAALGWPKSRSFRLISHLCKQGLVRPVGHAKPQGYVYGVAS